MRAKFPQRDWIVLYRGDFAGHRERAVAGLDVPVLGLESANNDSCVVENGPVRGVKARGTLGPRLVCDIKNLQLL